MSFTSLPLDYLEETHFVANLGKLLSVYELLPVEKRVLLVQYLNCFVATVRLRGSRGFCERPRPPRTRPVSSPPPPRYQRLRLEKDITRDFTGKEISEDEG